MSNHYHYFSKSCTPTNTIQTDDVNRRIFTRLATEMLRDPVESILVVATWLWLTQLGFPNIIPKICGVSDVIINVLADEAVLLLWSLRHLTTPRVNLTRGLPLTSCVLERPVSLHALAQHPAGAVASTGIRRVLSGLLLSRPVAVAEELRTLFLTFSRGFPVSREEVKGVFAGRYGECIERVEMGNGVTRVDQHCLYARLILKRVVTVERIMNGKRVVKLMVNGKHIWARRYEIRD